MAHGRTVETAASAEQVWKLWSDVGTWPGWNPDVLSVSIEGPFAAGSTGRMTTKAGGSHRITLTAVRPGRSFPLETSPIPLGRFAFECEVRPLAVSRCRRGVVLKSP